MKNAAFDPDAKSNHRKRFGRITVHCSPLIIHGKIDHFRLTYARTAHSISLHQLALRLSPTYFFCECPNLFMDRFCMARYAGRSGSQQFGCLGGLSPNAEVR